MKEETIIIIVAILSLTVVQIVALIYGVNGMLRAFIAAAIAGLAGWRIPYQKSVEVKL